MLLLLHRELDPLSKNNLFPYTTNIYKIKMRLEGLISTAFSEKKNYSNMSSLYQRRIETILISWL